MTGYYLLRAFSWLIYAMPLRVLYFHSDIFFLIMYHLFRYRRDVVNENLANSFPEKTKKERDQIAVKFYHHLCDCILETFYFEQISLKKAQKQITYVNAHEVSYYLDQGRQVIVLMGHYNNWECLNNWSLQTKYKSYPVYKKMRIVAFEKFFLHLRSRFGAEPLERALTFKQLYEDSRAGIPSVSIFIMDQTPREHDIQHWMTFLNQETPVLIGPEKVASKLNAVVMFVKIKKIRRGYYEVENELITDNSKVCPKFEITEKGNAILEKLIVENPQYWLWTHRKWKHKRSEIEQKKIC